MLVYFSRVCGNVWNVILLEPVTREGIVFLSVSSNVLRMRMRRQSVGRSVFAASSFY